MGLDTKTYWLIDRLSQCDIDSDSGRGVSSEFSVEDSHGKFVVWRLGVWLEDFIHVECVIQWDCYSSCVLIALPGVDKCVCVTVNYKVQKQR
jgi:hypothetical protein